MTNLENIKGYRIYLPKTSKSKSKGADKFFTDSTIRHESRIQAKYSKARGIMMTLEASTSPDIYTQLPLDSLQLISELYNKIRSNN